MSQNVNRFFKRIASPLPSRLYTQTYPKIAANADHRGVRYFSPNGTARTMTDDNKLQFPEAVLAPLPPSGIPDNLLRADIKKDEDIPLKLLLSDDVDQGEGDGIQLIINGKYIGEEEDLGDLGPNDTFTLYLTANDRNAAKEGLNDINYIIISGWTKKEFPSPLQSFIIDTTPPGRPFLGKIEIARDIIKNGLTLDKLTDDGNGGQYLSSKVPSYEGAAVGDIINPVLNGEVSLEEGKFVMAGDVGSDIELHLSREALEAAEKKGDGEISIAYIITDRAGNKSEISVIQPLKSLLSGAITDLDAPLVPDADDGLINYADGLKPTYATIPGNVGIKAGDLVLLTIGGTELSGVIVPSNGEAGTPLMDITIPFNTLYAEWAALTSGANQKVTIPISYTVVRNNITAGTSPSTNVPTNLHVPGGTPGPDPVHQSLKAPTVVADSGAINVISIDDSDKDAVVVVPWFNSESPAKPVFLLGDTVTVVWGNERLANYPVSAADVNNPKDLNITLPAEVIKQVGAGEITVFYEVSRDLNDAGDGSNVVRSPNQNVLVASKAELPGGENGLAAGSYAPVNSLTAIGPAEIRRGITFTLPVYVNQKVGDKVTFVFARFKGSSHKEGEAIVAGSEWTYESIISSATAAFVINIPQEYLVVTPGVSHADSTYTIENSVGLVTSEKKLQVIDARGWSATADE